MTYSKRIFGAAIIKASNANYNADFSGQPRTLPNGVVYATDKALKYTIKNFIKEFFPEQFVFYFKRINQQKREDAVPFSLIEAFCSRNPSLAEVVVSKKKDKPKVTQTDADEEVNEEGKLSVKLKANKTEVAKALLDCIDIRLFWSYLRYERC